jgi:hypothetical protein
MVLQHNLDAPTQGCANMKRLPGRLPIVKGDG